MPGKLGSGDGEVIVIHHGPWEKALWPFFVSSEGAVPMLF